MRNVLRGAKGKGMAMGFLLGILGGLIFLTPAGASFGTGDCIVVSECEYNDLESVMLMLAILKDGLSESVKEVVQNAVSVMEKVERHRSNGVEYFQNQQKMLVSAAKDVAKSSFHRGVKAAKFVQKIVTAEARKARTQK